VRCVVAILVVSSAAPAEEIRIEVSRGVVKTVDLEDYVAGVVAAEVPPTWPAEALKAQAVAARTFAVAQKVAQGPGARAHLTASVLDQVYKGTSDAGAQKAARETRGEVLTWGAAPIAAFFSASCGGRTESAEEAFNLAPGTTPYIQSEPDDDERPWTRSIKLAEIAKAVRGEVTVVKVTRRTASGRAKTISLGRRSITAVELRQLLGYRELPSLLFEVKTDGGAAVFTGKGSGHGVGLCQYGARERASRGATYREILAHYYPGAEIRRMY
jgi:stage II sporulation protein D